MITLESLPPPPALKYSAFMIRCGGRIPVDAVINWFNDLRTQRPDVPIGAVLRAGDASAFSVLRNGIQFTPLIAEHELVNGRVPPDVLETVWDHAIEGRILAVWRTRWNLDHPETEALAAAVAAVGIAGGGIKTLIRTLRCPETTLYRRFAGAHLPCPGELLRIARFESVDARIGLGMTEETAAAGAGWSDLRMYHQAKRRRDR